MLLKDCPWGNYFSPELEQNGFPVQGEGFLVNDLTDKAMAFMEKNQQDPFLVYLPMNTPHSPMQVPDRWWEGFAEKKLDSLVSGEDEEFTRAALAMCENIDWNVGRVMEKLEALDLVENTIVMYFSDNGPNSFRWNGGMKGRKGSTDEGGVRSPFFIQWKNSIPSGKVVREIVGAIDILPTLLDLLGLEYKGDKPLDGLSLKPLMLEERPDWEDRMIFSHWNGNISVRTNQYRLDKDGLLFDMKNDPFQQHPIQDHPEMSTKLLSAKVAWEKEMAAELAKDPANRPFTLGAPGATITQMPARDGIPHGSIERSNRFPNDSYFTNWVNPEDSITWEVEVLESGEFQVELYYTCPEKDLGAEFRLRIGDSQLEARVNEVHDPPLKGMENDRIDRMESYVKDFKAMKLGSIELAKGQSMISLKALKIPGNQVMEVQKLIFIKTEN